MSLNLQTLKTRSLTAAVFVVVMLTGLLWNSWSFLLLFTVIHFGCWFEYYKLLEKIFLTKINTGFKFIIAICGFALMLRLGYIGHSLDTLPLLKSSVFGKNTDWVLLFILFVLVLVFGFINKMTVLTAIGISLTGFIYISLSIGLFINLYQYAAIHIQDTYFIGKRGMLPMIVIASIWINDTMAYLVGSMIGKTPLSKISPKKTWEGTMGGIVLSVAVIGTAIYLIYPEQQLFLIGMLISALCAIFGTLGDLLESKLKRMANVKDSGSVMPGHGGFLDRFDSLLLAGPIVWICIYLFF